MAEDQEPTGPPPSSDVSRPAPAATDPRVGERPGDRIGPYHLLEVIGEGGFGVVFHAERREPVRQRVALKIIKAGMDTKQVIARFEAERQALALMDHPNVAKVFDAGATAHGRPYFVMEYVPGVPITDHCDRHRLDIPDRLRLFQQVCQGVQHAHQKGIIHRDIKPSNILVSVRESEAALKIIDFGVAKATAMRLTERTLFTELGQVIGTPAYMSPEQAEMSAQDIDTRSDVYSLGVLLYELLTGAPPFDPGTLLAAGLAEIQRIIREVDPPKPSTKLSSLGEQSRNVAQLRRGDARSLERELKGDLDWITMRALEKDRTRRYATANDLYADIARHLAQEPVLAGPPGATYRFKKFVLRNKGPVIAVTVLFFVLLAGLAATTGMYLRSERERARADQEAETARQISSFLTGLFKVSDPSESLGNRILAREILDRGAARIRSELKSQPVVQATMLDTMGSVYSSLGLFAEAKSMLEDAVAIWRSRAPKNGAQLAGALLHLADVYDGLGRFAESRPFLEEALDIRRREFGERSAEVATALTNLGMALHRMGDVQTANRMFGEALDIRRSLFGNQHPAVAESLIRVGGVAHSNGDFPTAETLYREALTIRRQAHGGLHPEVAESLQLLALLKVYQGALDEAETMFRECLEMQVKLFGEDDPRVGFCWNNLASVQWRKKDYEAAETSIRKALAISLRRLDGEHPIVASDLNTLARILRDQGRLAEAEPLHRQSVAIRRKSAQGRKDEYVGVSLTSLGTCLRLMERYPEAEEALLEGYDHMLQSRGKDHPRTAETLTELISLYEAWGKPERAAEFRALLPREPAAAP